MLIEFYIISKNYTQCPQIQYNASVLMQLITLQRGCHSATYVHDVTNRQLFTWEKMFFVAQVIIILKIDDYSYDNDVVIEYF